VTPFRPFLTTASPGKELALFGLVMLQSLNRAYLLQKNFEESSFSYSLTTLFKGTLICDISYALMLQRMKNYIDCIYFTHI
jgi:hypothetical protein